MVVLTDSGQLGAHVDVDSALLLQEVLARADVQSLRQQYHHAADAERVEVGGVNLQGHVGEGRLFSG